MKPLKFRVWDTQLNKWASVKNLLLIRIGKNKFYSFPSEDAERFVLQQFTELQDKNGNDIYEGDIIKSNMGNYYFKNFIGEVKRSKHGGFYSNITISLGEGLDILHGSREIEIIGNIFDDPDLMKKLLKF